MTTIKEIDAEIKKLLNETEEEAIEEVKERYAPFNESMGALLEADDIDSYLTKYEEISKDESTALKCFNLDTTEELTAYIADKEISFDDLKRETAQATCEALKFVIYDSEEDDDY